ncbi:50S ribosomal protein L32 [Bifidobacterium tissieri]|uniref:Large ribosomal subunit protein bL32 n=1 Tax=Bifidobacterium tissieri TaxID=1630162 RepID=A0A261FJ11_9BIFI|nr:MULTISPECIES: 50S ribosomal protein L32 [Bifidobacterium]OZG59119.1 50S ribosomal protein L32 [Bifidobacterium tissieri]
MAHPKVRKSRANTHSRRANWKTKPVDLATVTTPDGSTVQVPHHLASAARRGYLDI